MGLSTTHKLLAAAAILFAASLALLDAAPRLRGTTIAEYLLEIMRCHGP